MLVLMLAAAAGAALAADTIQDVPGLTAPHIYLHRPADGCDGQSSKDEVVVCADKDADKRYRLHPIDTGKYADPPVRAETKFAGGVLGIAGSQTSVGGFPSNRIMLSFKIKF